MKFKAVMTDQLCMKDFLNIIVTFSKLSKEAVFNIKENGINMINNTTAMSTNPFVWATIDQNALFTQFSMGGVDDEYNEIWLALSPVKLASALALLKNFVKNFKIKLTKKQFPCLTIDIELSSGNTGNNRRIVHDVPVTIIPTRDWSEHKIPRLPTMQASIKLPTLRSLKSLCDKMKNLAPTLTICCGVNGELSFIVETDSAMVASRYYNLALEKHVAEGDNANGEPEEIACRVDTKQLALCFASMQFQNIRVTGNMVQDNIFNITVCVRDNVTMNCIIQAVDV